MSDKTIGVPSVKGVGSAFKDFAVGAGGGLIFLLAYRLFGGLGILAAPLLAGSILKGDRGSTVAVMSGFMLLAMSAFAGGGSTASSDSVVM